MVNISIYLICLVVWNMFFIFPYIWNVIIPTDELIFFRGVAQPPTSNGKYIYIYLDIFTIDHSYPSELNGPRKKPNDDATLGSSRPRLHRRAVPRCVTRGGGA